MCLLLNELKTAMEYSLLTGVVHIQHIFLYKFIFLNIIPREKGKSTLYSCEAFNMNNVLYTILK